MGDRGIHCGDDDLGRKLEHIRRHGQSSMERLIKWNEFAVRMRNFETGLTDVELESALLKARVLYLTSTDDRAETRFGDRVYLLTMETPGVAHATRTAPNLQ